MPIVKTDSGRIYFKKTKQMLVLPYRYDNNLRQYVLGQTLYDISSIVGDTISIEQGDGEVQTKNNEFKNVPLVRNATTGEWKFTAQCIDAQHAVLKSLFAAYTYEDIQNTSVKAAALRSDYVTLFALVIVRFADTSMPDVWLPKVQMNNKFMMQQMKTSVVKCNIDGVIVPSKCGVVMSTEQVQSRTRYNLMPFSDIVNGRLEYTPEVPILFVQRSAMGVLVYNHDVGDSTYYDMPNLSDNNQDCCSHGYVVNDAARNYARV